MNSRRKFIIQGGLVTTAIIAAKPFSALAGTTSKISSLTGANSLMFIHTTGVENNQTTGVIERLAEIRNTNSNAILLKAVDTEQEDHSLTYDASFQCNDIAYAEGEYKIMNKGGLKVGVIGAVGTGDIMERTERLASYLKSNHGCEMVVCLSQLGFKNANKIDDENLATSSSSIDIIIGGRPENASDHTMVIINSKKSEVIIDSASSSKNQTSFIQFDFNQMGMKKMISFTNKFKQEGA